MKKNQTFRRLLTLLLAVAVCLSVLPWSAMAVEGETAWTEVALEDIQPTDTVAVVMHGAVTDKDYVLLNNGGTQTYGPAEVWDANTTNQTTWHWNVGKQDGGYVFYPAGTTETWLYCTAANNGLRVGNGETASVWSLDADSGYLKCADTKNVTRYLGVYDNNNGEAVPKPNFRTYKNTTGNTKNQTLKFYRLNGGSAPVDPFANAVITADRTEESLSAGVAVKFTLAPAVEGAVFQTRLDEGAWTALEADTYTIPADCTLGSHKLEVKAVKDNQESKALTLNFFVEGFEPVTELATLLEGGSYVLLARTDDTYHALGTEVASKKVPAVTVSVSNGTVTGENVPVWTVAASGEGVSLSVDGSYLKHTGSTNLALDSSAFTWNVSAENGTFRFISGTAADRALAYQTSNDRFGGYSTKNASDYVMDLLLYRYVSKDTPVNPDPDPQPTPAELTTGDYVIWAPAYNMALSSTYGSGSYYNSGVEVTESGDKLTGYGATEIWHVTVNADKTITIAYGDQNLGMAEKYTSMSLGAVNDVWTLEDAGNGLYYVKNTVREAYIEWYAENNNWSSYYTISSGSEGMFALKFTPAEAGGTDVPDDGAPKDGAQVALYHPATSLALSATASGTRLVGVEGTVSGGKLIADGAETLTAHVDANGYYTFTTAAGKYLTTGATGGSLTLADAGSELSLWALEQTEGGWLVRSVNANYNQNYNQYIEVYGGNFTVYGKKSNSDMSLFVLQFYPLSNVKDYETDTDLVENIAQWGGGGPYDDAQNEHVYGDRYTVGDMLDTDAIFTIIANGQPGRPYQKTSTSTGGNNYYMGGEKIGAAAGDYMQFAVSTAGWGDMTLSFRMRTTAAAPGSWQLQYSTDGGTTFENFTAGSYSCSYTIYGSDGSTTNNTSEGTITDGIAKTSVGYQQKKANYVSFSFTVPTGAENCANLLIRLVPGSDRADGKTDSISGNVRIDNVVLAGSPILDESVTGHVTVTPDGVEEDQKPGTELTMTSATADATIYYRFNGGEWQKYDGSSKPTVPQQLPAHLEVYAKVDGKADSVVRMFTYEQGRVSSVKVSPNGGSVYIADGTTLKVTLSCDTDGAVIYYNLDNEVDSMGNLVWKEYTEPLTLEKGFGSSVLQAYATKEGFRTSDVTTRTFTERSSEKYSIFFGQLHSHTNYSDGAGTCEDAFKHATGVGNLDFLAVTDHSNSLDGADSCDLGTNTAGEWTEGHELADKYTSDTFTGIFGYEMTWSNGLGHINTFNTPGFQSRTQKDYSTYSTALQNYYEKLKTQPDSISQFNHPGTTFGDFSDFAHYDEEIDKLITLIEVGNGEGAIGSSGYFPSYEYYTRALDKGWHVAPTNNQDNHKGNWGDSNTARSVVLTDDLSREGIYDAMRNYRVYATEDNDLSIYYTLNGNVMGTILGKGDVGETVNLKVELDDPTDNRMGKVEVIVNGGLSVASKTVTSASETVEFAIPSSYSYYYIKVTQEDGDIAVTAPVWVGAVEAVGISGLSTDAALPVQGQSLNLTLDLYNNERKDLLVDSIEFSIGDEVIHTTNEITKVGKTGTASYTFAYAHKGLGSTIITATVRGTLNGVEKVYTEKLTLNYVTPDMVTRVIVDGTHYNDYVTGYYGGNLGNLTEIAAESQIEVSVVTDAITPQMLQDCSLLIISAPAKKTGTANAGDYTPSLFEDAFIQMVADYVKNGGSVVVCGLADYQDKSAPSADYHSAAQINRLLAAIGSTMSINDDEVCDDEQNGGQNYRLYPTVFNTDSKWTNGILDGQQYSQYSGCSVNVGNGTWLVNGYDSTYSIDSDKDGIGGLDKGEVTFLAAEDTPYGGTIFAAGGVFVSDFEVKAELDNIWDLPYANRTIIENIMGSVRVELPLSTIAEVRKGGMGEVFRIRGYATAGRMEGNAFFDAMYVQDETGGITVFPIGEDGVIDVGTPIEIVGYVDAYQGDLEIQIMSYKILDEAPYVWAPQKMDNKSAMDYATNGGKLIQVEGEVVEVEYGLDGVSVNQFVVKDAKGDLAKVFIDGYILSSTTGKNELASVVKVGNTVSAVGLLYMHPEGSSDESVAVLRVRDCDEVVLVGTGVNPNPNTGDSFRPVSMVCVLMLSVAALAALLLDRKKLYR